MKSRLLALLAMALISCAPHQTDSLSGYIEAEYTHIASPIGGRLEATYVERGALVKRGDALFTLESTQEAAAVRQDQARLARSAANQVDQSKGKRKDELAVLHAQEKAAQLALQQAEDTLRRQTELAKVGYVSTANLTELQTQLELAQARVNEVAAQLKVAKLAAREDAQKAALADVAAAKAGLAQTQWRLDQKNIRAPVDAQIDNVFYRVGEWVPPGVPVMALLEAKAIKVRFFIPQAKLALIKPGAQVLVSCDGCQVWQARVSYIANRAEFTPPVIYSKENRAKLVFLVEAKLDAQTQLKPGQIVDVRLELP